MTRFIHGEPTNDVPVVNDRDVLRDSTHTADYEDPPTSASAGLSEERFEGSPGWIDLVARADVEQDQIDRNATRIARRLAGETMAEIKATE